MRGLHLIADLRDCACPPGLLLDADGMRDHCIAACVDHGLQVVGSCFHPFAAPEQQEAGFTGTVLLAESHLAVHTWPELRAVTLDLYVCNMSADHSEAARQLFAALIARFQPGQTQRQEIQRGV